MSSSSSCGGSFRVDADAVSITTDTVATSPRGMRSPVKVTVASPKRMGMGGPDPSMLAMQEMMCEQIQQIRCMMTSLSSTVRDIQHTQAQQQQQLQALVGEGAATQADRPPPSPTPQPRATIVTGFRGRAVPPPSNFGAGLWGRAMQKHTRHVQVAKQLAVLTRRAEEMKVSHDPAPLSTRRASALLKARAVGRLKRKTSQVKPVPLVSPRVPATDAGCGGEDSAMERRASLRGLGKRRRSSSMPASPSFVPTNVVRGDMRPHKRPLVVSTSEMDMLPEAGDVVPAAGKQTATKTGTNEPPQTVAVLGVQIPRPTSQRKQSSKAGGEKGPSPRRDPSDTASDTPSKEDAPTPSSQRGGFGGPIRWGLNKNANAFGIRKASNLASVTGDRPSSARASVPSSMGSAYRTTGSNSSSDSETESTKPTAEGSPRALPQSENKRAFNPLGLNISGDDEPVLLNTDVHKVTTDVLTLVASLIENMLISYTFAIELAEPTPVYLALTALCLPVFAYWIALNFKTAVLKGWILIDSRQRIRKYYIRTWFFFDVFLTLPWDISVGWLSSPAFRVFSGLRVIRVLRVPYLLQPSNPVQERPVWMQAATGLFWTMCVCHWAACSWIFTASFEEQGYTEEILNGTGFTGMRISQYIAAQYWTCATITSTGYGDISGNSEYARLVSTVWMWFGVGAIIWGGARVTQWMVVADPFVLAEMDKKRQLYALMANNSIPWKIQKSALSVYPVVLETSSHDYNSIIEELPRFLQDQIRLHVKLKLIRKVPIFSGVCYDCLIAVAQITVPEQYSLDSNIIAYGEQGSEMFLLEHGIVEVYTYNEVGQEIWMANLKGGSFFGEISLLSDDCRRTATVRAVTNCVIYTLTKESFDHVVRLYPDLKARVEEEAHVRLKDIKSVLTWAGKVRQATMLMRLQPRDSDRPPVRHWKLAMQFALRKVYGHLDGEEHTLSENARKAEERAADHDATVPSQGTFLEPASFLPLQPLNEHELMVAQITDPYHKNASITFSIPPTALQSRGSRAFNGSQGFEVLPECAGDSLPPNPPPPPPSSARGEGRMPAVNGPNTIYAAREGTMSPTSLTRDIDHCGGDASDPTL